MRNAWLLPLLILMVPTGVVEADGFAVDDPAIRASFAQLVRQSGYGWWHTEEAAFVVRGDDGRYRLVVWQTAREFEKRTFRGAIPEGAVAIVHTHPRDTPDASPGDRQTARRLSMPVVILTPMNIVMVKPDGRSVAVVRNQRWVRSADPTAP